MIIGIGEAPPSKLIVPPNKSIVKPAETTHAEKSPLTIGAQRLEKLAQTDPTLNPIDKRAVIDTAANFREMRNAIKDRVDFLTGKNITDPRALYALCTYGRPELGPSALDAWIIYGFPLGVTHDVNTEGKKNVTMVARPATPETMRKIMEALEYVQPGENMNQRINRINGKPGITTNTFTINNETGANIAFNPEKAAQPEFTAYVWLDSPMMGNHATIRSTVGLTKQGESIATVDNTIKDGRFCFTAPEGTTREQYQAFIGKTLFRYGV